jgi:RNA polymerase sigma-70 factor (ECF subfamily)
MLGQSNFPECRDPSPGSTSISLIARVKTRDPEAWRHLGEIYAPLTYFWCRKSGVAAEDARDVVQDVFSAMWKSIDGFNLDGQSGSFRGWLATITQSKIADHWRKRLRNPAGAGGTDAQRRLKELGTSDTSHSSTQLPADIQRSGLLHRAVQLVRNEFEHKTWELFRRVVLDGEAVADVAAANAVSPCAVRQAKSRVLRRIRKELELPGGI